MKNHQYLFLGLLLLLLFLLLGLLLLFLLLLGLLLLLWLLIFLGPLLLKSSKCLSIKLRCLLGKSNFAKNSLSSINCQLIELQ